MSVNIARITLCLARLAKRVGSQMQNIDWEERLRGLPENAPPRWMFRNISTIRENTDRILELLEHEGPSERSTDSDAEKLAT